MKHLILFGFFLSSSLFASDTEASKPVALVADGLPAVPNSLVAATRPYLESRAANFMGFNNKDRSILMTTRFGNVAQLHQIAMPGGARTQISFEQEPVAGTWSPKGDVLVVAKDSGGDEFFQLYTLKEGRLTLLTDGKSRNTFGAWSKDGRWFAYSSTRRNGTDSDIYVMDPRDPSSNRRVAEVNGGGWRAGAFDANGHYLLIQNFVSVRKLDLWLLDLATLKREPLGDHAKEISYGRADFDADGTIWATSDEDADFKRLGTIDRKSQRFSPVTTETRWDVDDFDLSPDGRFVAYTMNVAGASVLKVMDLKTRRTKEAELPTGVIGAIKVAPWGDIGLSLSSARSPADIYVVNPKSLLATRWTQSETGGLDPNVNSIPTLLTIKSFDGEEVSGFLYLPDSKKFPGKRPLIINIHGGPESQAQPGFLGRNNYLINELGMALFLPNVRGSTGFGSRFVNLDNGPFLRENSVKDIGAFLEALKQNPHIDSDKIGVAGGSYGGYMCYASAIAFGSQLRGALCTVAISNFVTFLENTQSYRRDLRRVEYGDERDPIQRAKLLAISPLTRANEIKIPLFVVTGANDPRVPKSEADQMVSEVRKGNGIAWHLVGMNEGHGFAKKENSDYLFLATLVFWSAVLK